MIEQIPTVLAPHLACQREVSNQFDDLSHMIIIFGEKSSLGLGIKEVLPSQEFKYLFGYASIPFNDTLEPLM